MRVGAFSADGRLANLDNLASLNSSVLRFVQCMALGVGALVEAHVIVPTTMGMLLDTERDLLMTTFRLQQKTTPASFELINKYDECVFKRCAFCFAKLRQDCKKLRQIVLHVVGGKLSAASNWTYEIMFGLLCWKCQTVPWSSMLRIDEFCYSAICDQLARHAFKQSLSLESLTLIHDNNERDALADSYIVRMVHANAHTKEIVRAVCSDDGRNDADGDVICYHCMRVRKHKDCLACPGCDAVFFCRGLSPDKRMGDNRCCMELAMYYHFDACRLIKSNRLFDTEYSRYVTPEEDDIAPADSL